MADRAPAEVPPMRVISASRRTDIPAFYSRWFMNRVRAGYCHWLNPFGGQVQRVSLAPNDVLAVVFWTRSFRPLLPHVPELRERGLPCYVHTSLTGYPRELETHNPPLDAAVASFRETAAAIGSQFVHWRYDPIVISARTPAAYHIEQFDRISERLAGSTSRCYFSFVDRYGKTERGLARVEREHGLGLVDPTRDEQRALVHRLRDIAARRGITLYACCESGLVGDGIKESRCIDLDTVKLLRRGRDLTLKRAPTRAACGCVEAVDIGAYDLCLFGCAYCYATNSRAAAERRHREHDPEDSLLWRPAALRGVDLSTRELRSKARSPLPLFT